MLLESHDRFTLVYPRFSDFDIQGILNSRQYVELVNEARIEQMRRHYRLPMEDYAKKHQSWVLSHFSIDFVKPILFGMNFFVQTHVDAIENDLASIGFSFVDTTKEKLFAKGKVNYHLMDMKARKPMNISEEDRKIYLGM